MEFPLESMSHFLQGLHQNCILMFFSVYRAPELLVGDTQYGAPVDVWAIGKFRFIITLIKKIHHFKLNQNS